MHIEINKSLLFQSHRSHHHHHCHQSHYRDLLYRHHLLVVDLHKKSACTNWCTSDHSGYKYNCPEHILFCNHMTEVPLLPEEQVALLPSQWPNPHLPCTIHCQQDLALEVKLPSSSSKLHIDSLPFCSG